MSYVPPSRESSITVAVRVRPFTDAEKAHLVKNKQEQIFLGDGSLSFTNSDKENSFQVKNFGPKGIRKIVDVVDDRMLIFDPPETNPLANISKNILVNGKKNTSRFREHRFVFDKLFDENASQEDVYLKTTQPLLDSVLDGFNATVFAYGATGCGKTHTISGTLQEPGVIFLTMKELFEKIDDLSDTKIVDVSLSYLEIYNETIKDLINTENNTNGKILTLREDANKRITVSNLSEHKPKCVQDVMDMILIGNANRTCSPTEANATSSRSHAVLQINITQRNRTADIRENHTFATLSIIDLAGSERAAATKNRGQRLHEGANINRSLLALGNCINALCDVRRRNHVPYRDSKLTRLLKFSLGGNCKTVMIVCISPSSVHYDETLNTLKYADRAKEIKTKLMRNQHNIDRHVGSYLKMITEQKNEIEELRNREKLVIEQSINRFKIKRERVAVGVLEFIDTLKQNLNSRKFQTLKFKKSLILCKRQLLLIQSTELDKIRENLKMFLNTDVYQLAEILEMINELIDKINNKIIELESLFNKETEIDLILSNSADTGIRKLMELEAWSDYDKLTLDMSIMLIKDSFEKTILQNSTILFDKMVKNNEFMNNFKFLVENLFQLISDLSNNSDNLESLVNKFYDNFKYSIQDILNFDTKFDRICNQLQNSTLNSDIKIPTSPIRQLASKSRLSNSFNNVASSRLSSKITKSTSSTSSPSSRLEKPKSTKKVRWDVKLSNNENSSIPMDTHDSDISMEDFKEQSTIDEIKLNDANEDESILDQSFQEIEKVFQSNKRKSLTSLTLKPVKSLTSTTSTASTTAPAAVAHVESANILSNNQNGQSLGAPIRLNDLSINSNNYHHNG